VRQLETTALAELAPRLEGVVETLAENLAESA
jgi:hypothetical protein